jgi:hypothetical protein
MRFENEVTALYDILAKLERRWVPGRCRAG